MSSGVPFEQHIGGNFKLQDDNACSHWAYVAVDFLKQQGVNIHSQPSPPICHRLSTFGMPGSPIMQQTAVLQQFAVVADTKGDNLLLTYPDGVVHASVLMGHGPDTVY